MPVLARKRETPAGGTSPRVGTPRLVPAGVLAVILAVALVVALSLAVTWGSSNLSMTGAWSVVSRRLSGQPPRPGTDDLLVWQLRIPRALLAALVGAGLGLVGTAVQALVRNPLADPYLLGISSGAAFAAVAGTVLGVSGGFLAGVGLSTAAFAGALATFGLVWFFGRRAGGFSPLRLVLAGVGIGQLLGGLTSYLVLQAEDAQQTNGVLFWLMGSLGGASWENLPAPALAVAAAFVVLQWKAHALNAIMLGDETASALGVDGTRLRRQLFVVTSLLTGVLVAVSGAIGFVGLLVPHVCRMLVGGDHRRLLPASALCGAVLMAVVDLVCRTALDDQELPVGVVTSVLGAPTLLYLINRRLGGGTS